jgi:hypothetical protein
VRNQKPAHNGGKESPRVTVPLAAAGALRIRDQGASQLLDVIGQSHLAVDVPFGRALIEGIQDDIAALRIIEPLDVPAVRVRNDGAIAARQGVGE